MSDMSGRGFTKDESTLTKDFKRPREHIRAAENMDSDNRYFAENKRLYETYSPKKYGVNEQTNT